MDKDIPTGPAVRFDLGPVSITPGALEALRACGADPMQYLRRHAAGDWGCIDEADRQDNQAALQTGACIMSAYTLPDGARLWVITDAEIDDQHNRQATTLLLHDER